MPALANITVKKSDGTTDVVYTAITGAGQDGTPAVFRNNTVGTSPAERPTLLIVSKSNGPKTARRVNVDYTWPIVSTDPSGVKTVTGRATGQASFLAPQNQDVATIKEQAYQFGNLIGSALVKACFDEGNSAR